MEGDRAMVDHPTLSSATQERRTKPTGLFSLHLPLGVHRESDATVFLRAHAQRQTQSGTTIQHDQHDITKLAMVLPTQNQA